MARDLASLVNGTKNANEELPHEEFVRTSEDQSFFVVLNAERKTMHIQFADTNQALT